MGPNYPWNLVRLASEIVATTSSLNTEFLGLDFERSAYERLLHTEDRLEALEAFKEKRKPVFKGE